MAALISGPAVAGPVGEYVVVGVPWRLEAPPQPGKAKLQAQDTPTLPCVPGPA